VLLEFILNVENISGTKIHEYLKLAVEESSPQIYQPRQGKVLGNMVKFDADKLEFIYQYAH